MFGLTAEALITTYERTQDARIPQALKVGADWIWQNMWLPASSAFQYMSVEVAGVGGPDPAPDLNLLIAPVYAWLYNQTGLNKYRDAGDQIFAGGVKLAYLDNPK
jgi:hypothetical protein